MRISDWSSDVCSSDLEVRDLFFATPARLKFLKTARTETSHVQDALSRLAMAHPAVGFTLGDGERRLLSLAPAEGELFAGRLKRLGALMGRAFADNALPIEALREGIRLTGYTGLTSVTRGHADPPSLLLQRRPVERQAVARGQWVSEGVKLG